MTEWPQSPHGPRLRLSTGIGWFGWISLLAIVLTSAVLVACAALLWRDAPALVGVVVSLPALCCVILTGWVSIASYHSAFWLHGTTLTQRRIGGVRHWDLSTASIVAGNAYGNLIQPTGPALFVSGPGMTRLKLRLKRSNPPYRLIPSRELLALANAITYGRAHDPQIRPVADQLRGRAHSLFGEGW